MALSLREANKLESHNKGRALHSEHPLLDYTLEQVHPYSYSTVVLIGRKVNSMACGRVG